MANASLKWNNHITGILTQIEGQDNDMDRMDNEEMDDENLVNEANAEDEEDKQN